MVQGNAVVVVVICEHCELVVRRPTAWVARERLRVEVSSRCPVFDFLVGMQFTVPGMSNAGYAGLTSAPLKNSSQSDF